MINSNQKKIILSLLEKEKTILELANILGVSQRLIYKNINYCNNNFCNYFKIIKDNKKYSLKLICDKKTFLGLLNLQSGMSQDERRSYLIYKLLVDEDFNMEYERKQMDVSRSTIKGDMIFIKEYIKNYNLNLEYVKNRYQILETKDSLKHLLLMKNFYLFLKNTSLSKLHSDYIKNNLKEFDLDIIKNRIIVFLKKYILPISDDIINFLLSYKLIQKFKKTMMLNKKTDFFRYYLYFFNEKNIGGLNSEILSISFDSSSTSKINFDSKELYQQFINTVSSEFSLDVIKLNKKEEFLFFKNLNFLLLKNNILNILPQNDNSIGNSYLTIKNIFKDIYDLNISQENYCFIFLLQNIILNKKIKILKRFKILIFIDSLNKELIYFLEKELYSKFKLFSIVFETKQELLNYEKFNPYLVIISNVNLNIDKSRILIYYPEQHYIFLSQLEEYLIYYSDYY
ncbi:MAG: hypothetical protein ACRC51_08895 [Cetobacterium sp.]